MREGNSQSMLVLEKTFDCSAERIWSFWTNPDLMRLWFGSDPNGIVLVASSNPEVNGSFSVTFRNSNGTEHTCSGIYTVVEPFKMLVFTWYWSGREENVEVVSVGFEQFGDCVTMVFKHKDIDPETSHDYRLGWVSTFEKLAKAIQMSSSKPS